MQLISLRQRPAGTAETVDLRRAVSAAYYALFYRLGEATVAQIAPNVTPKTGNRIHRWLDHSEMKKICEQFAADQLRPPLRDLLGPESSAEMRTVASSFIKLQEARHKADYDLDWELSWFDARALVLLAFKSIDAWDKISPSAESNIFVLSLLLWKKWEAVRQ